MANKRKSPPPVVVPTVKVEPTITIPVVTEPTVNATVNETSAEPTVNVTEPTKSAENPPPVATTEGVKATTAETPKGTENPPPVVQSPPVFPTKGSKGYYISRGAIMEGVIQTILSKRGDYRVRVTGVAADPWVPAESLFASPADLREGITNAGLLATIPLPSVNVGDSVSLFAYRSANGVARSYIPCVVVSPGTLTPIEASFLESIRTRELPDVPVEEAVYLRGTGKDSDCVYVARPSSVYSPLCVTSRFVQPYAIRWATFAESLRETADDDTADSLAAEYVKGLFRGTAETVNSPVDTTTAENQPTA